jgi:hypothetical protein
MLRLLKRGDRKSLEHVGYRIGELLCDILPGIDDGEHAQELPAYFDHISQLVADAKTSDFINQSNWRGLTSKTIYIAAYQVQTSSKSRAGGWLFLQGGLEESVLLCPYT